MKKDYYNVDLTEFNKLAEMLDNYGIQYENRLFSKEVGNGRQIIIYKDGNYLCSCICHYGSYGKEEGLLEIMGGLTVEENKRDIVLGYLTAQEVFDRFKYCYENNTSFYEVEE